MSHENNIGRATKKLISHLNLCMAYMVRVCGILYETNTKSNRKYRFLLTFLFVFVFSGIFILTAGLNMLNNAIIFSSSLL